MSRFSDNGVAPGPSPATPSLSPESARGLRRALMFRPPQWRRLAAHLGRVLGLGLSLGLCFGLCLSLGTLSCTPRRLPAHAPAPLPEPALPPEVSEVETPGELAPIEAPRPEPEHVENWEAFANSVRMLREEIQRGDHALKIRGADEAPVGLASLRLCLDAWNLIQAGDSERAADLLERAISLDGRNGFSYLFLAYAYHRSARFEQGRLFLQQAWRYLPYDPRVLGEFEGLKQSIELNTGNSAGG